MWGCVFLHVHSLLFHLPHDLFGFLVFELIELICVELLASTGFLLALLLLLLNDFVPYDLFHDLNIRLNSTMLLRMFPKSSFSMFGFNLGIVIIGIFLNLVFKHENNKFKFI